MGRGQRSDKVGGQFVRDEPTYSTGEIRKECVPIWERIRRLRWRVIHEREMAGAFDDVYIY
jgi:hypothetical protein